jgi:hypothetical protein
MGDFRKSSQLCKTDNFSQNSKIGLKTTTIITTGFPIGFPYEAI